jgi:hypothetical protein
MSIFTGGSTGFMRFQASPKRKRMKRPAKGKGGRPSHLKESLPDAALRFVFLGKRSANRIEKT